MENISSARRIDCRNVVSRRMEKNLVVPGQDTLLTQRRRSETALILALHKLDRHLQIGLACESTGDIAADNQVVHHFQQLFDAGIQLIEISDYGYFGGASPASSGRSRLGIEAIHMQRAGAFNPG